MGSIARVTQYQLIAFVRGTILYNSANVANGLIIGHIPNGARLLEANVWVEVAQNAGTTNTVSVGTIPETNGVLSTPPAAQSNLVSAAAAGAQAFTRTNVPVAASILATDVAVVASLAQSGTAATAGTVTVAVTYIPNL